MLSSSWIFFTLYICKSESFLINRSPVVIPHSPLQQRTVWKADHSILPLRFRFLEGRIQSHLTNEEELEHDAPTTISRPKIGVRHRLKRMWNRLGGPKAVATLMLALLCGLGNVSAAAAVSGGRMGGGSFNSRSSSPSRSRPQSYSYSSPPRSYTTRYNTRPIILTASLPGLSEWYAPSRSTLIVNTRVSAKDIAILTGAGVLLSYGYRSNLQRRRMEEDGGGPLGPGFTVGSVTVALQLPDRSAKDQNILRQLSQWSLSADTVTRKGLQELLSSVTLELLRNESMIQSAVTQSQQYSISGQAEREFQVLSVASQKKVDRLTVNKFGTRSHISASTAADAQEASSSPTAAIVTINFCMEGDSTLLPVIRSREDLRTALSLIASDALVGECLVTAEILWSPEDPTETLSNEEMIANYPDLVPI